MNLPTLICRFGLVETPAEFVSGEHILCQTPVKSEPGIVQLGVSLNGVDFSAQGLEFSFLSMVNLLRLKPGAGPVGGGTTVTIVGSRFSELRYDGVWISCRWEMVGTVAFEGALGTPASISSDSELICVSPAAGERGRAYVSVYANGVSVSPNDAALDFEYEILARTIALHPAYGKLSGGTRITVTGDGFVDGDGLVCKFRSLSVGPAQLGNSGSDGVVVDVPGKFLTSKEVQCVSPSLEELVPSTDHVIDVGQVTVSVCNHDWVCETCDPAKGGIHFWYRPQPEVSGLLLNRICGLKTQHRISGIRRGASEFVRIYINVFEDTEASSIVRRQECDILLRLPRLRVPSSTIEFRATWNDCEPFCAFQRMRDLVRFLIIL